MSPPPPPPLILRFIYAGSEGSDETARMRKLFWASAAQLLAVALSLAGLYFILSSYGLACMKTWARHFILCLVLVNPGRQEIDRTWMINCWLGREAFSQAKEGEMKNWSNNTTIFDRTISCWDNMFLCLQLKINLSLLLKTNYFSKYIIPVL